MNTNDSFLLAEATTLHRAGKLNEAENKYRSLLNEDEANAVVHNNLGFLLEQLDRSQESIHEYRRAIEISPDYSTAYTNLGQTLLLMNQWQEAEELLLKAVELDSNDPHANKSLAKYYMLKADTEKAEAYFRSSYAIRPSNDILLDLAWCLLAQQRPEEAVTMLGYAEDAEKNNPRLYSLWGIIHFADNNFGQAIYYFRQSLGLEPENIETRNSLVACLLKTGDTEEAGREMQRILLMQPDHIESLNNLAVLAVAVGQYASSLHYLNKVLEKDRENGKALYYKAMICVQQEKKKEALILLRNINETGNSAYADKAHEALELLAEVNES